MRGRSGVIDAHAHLGFDAALFYNGDFPYGISAEDHGVRMAAYGIDAVVCFPLLYTDYFQLTAFRRGGLLPADGLPARVLPAELAGALHAAV
jgi:hypothetical protein